MDLSQETIQIGGFIINIFMALIAIVASLISYAIYSDSSSPDVIVYIEQDRQARIMLNLIIKNVGRGSAKNIKFKKSTTEKDKSISILDKSILSTGIPYLAPGAERIIMLGSYSDVNNLLDNSIVKIDSTYNRTRKILFFSRKIKTSSYLDIVSFTGVLASDNSNENKIYSELKRIKSELSNMNKILMVGHDKKDN